MSIKRNTKQSITKGVLFVFLFVFSLVIFATALVIQSSNFEFTNSTTNQISSTNQTIYSHLQMSDNAPYDSLVAYFNFDIPFHYKTHSLINKNAPYSTDQAGVEVLGDSLYVIGGWDLELSEASNRTFLYNFTSNSWEIKTDLPIKSQSPILRTVNGKLYLIGGYDNAISMWNRTYEYDPATDTWTRKSDMPSAREDFGSAVVDGKIYTFGGLNTQLADYNYELNVTEIYDPATDTWTTGSDMPEPKWSGDFCESYNKIIYCIGSTDYYSDGPGGLLDYSNIFLKNTTLAYDTQTDTWSYKAQIPVAVAYKEVSEIDGKLYIIGGVVNPTTTNSTNITQVYDISTDTWDIRTSTSHPAVAGTSTAVYNNKIYYLGSFAIAYDTWFYVFDPYGFNSTETIPAKPPLYNIISGNDSNSSINYDTYANGGVVLDNGPYGSFVKFDGTVGYANLGDAFVNGPPATLCAWVKLDDLINLGQPVILSIGNGTAGNHIALQAMRTDSSSINYFKLRTYTTYERAATGTTNASETVGKWTHLCGVYTNTSHRAIYVNGLNEGNNTNTQDELTGLTETSLGVLKWNSFTYWLNGSIDEIMIFNSSLSGAQIQSIYNNQSARFKSPGAINQKLTNYTEVKLGYDKVNLTTEFKNLEGQVNASIGFYNGSWHWTSPQVLTSDSGSTFTIDDSSTNITVNFTLLAEAYNFFSPSLKEEFTLLSYTSDTDSPNISLVSPPNAYTETSSSATINFQFNVTDVLSNVVYCSISLDGTKYANTSAISETKTNTISISSIATGSHSWYVYCNDTVDNNANSSSRSFTINAPEEETTTSSGGTPTSYPTELSLQKGYSKSLGLLWKVNFEHQGESHQLKIDKIYSSNKSVTITIYSEPQTKTLLIGEEWKVNLDRDSYYDLLVRLENITSSKANVFIQKINEIIPGQAGHDIHQKENLKKKIWDKLDYLAVLVLVFLVFFYIRKKKKRDN